MIAVESLTHRMNQHTVQYIHIVRLVALRPLYAAFTGGGSGSELLQVELERELVAVVNLGEGLRTHI